LDYVGKCRRKATAKMKKLKKDFDYNPEGIDCKRKKILDACTEADLNVNTV